VLQCTFLAILLPFFASMRFGRYSIWHNGH